MRIALLGGFRVSVGIRAIEEDAWYLRKAANLEKPAREYALSEEKTEPSMTPTPERPAAGEPIGKLTRREEGVAVLVARGLTNRQNSTHLRISERTADNHVGRILGKQGLRSRTQVASWAIEHELLAPDPE